MQHPGDKEAAAAPARAETSDKPHWRRGPHLQKRRERLGVHLRELRREKKLSLEVFADKIGASRWTVAEWETGVRSIPVEIMPTMAKVLGVSVTALVRVIATRALGAAA